MKLVLFESITIASNRQRRTFEPGSLLQLMESIRARGLMHPIVVRDDLTLIAGERRLRVINDLHKLGIPFRCGGELVERGFVPTLTLGELSPLEALEAELEENVHRADLTWQERSAAIARIAEIRSQQAFFRGDPPPTVADISTEVRGSSKGSNQEYTRRELILAKHLDDPEIARAGSVDEAFKLLRIGEERRRNALLAEQYGRDFTAETHTLRHGNSYELLAGLPAESFDVLLTDPPYGMGADEFGDSGGKVLEVHGYADSPEAGLKAAEFLAEEGFRLAKPQAHFYSFCDLSLFDRFKLFLQRAGWTVFRTPLVWHKPDGQMAPWPQMGPQRKYELLIFAVKGKRPVLKVAGDVLSHPHDPSLGVRAQKPVSLFLDLLARSTNPGDSVLDPFCGTGPIFPAAHALKVRAVGIELSSVAYGIALTRLKGLK